MTGKQLRPSFFPWKKADGLLFHFINPPSSAMSFCFFVFFSFLMPLLPYPGGLLLVFSELRTLHGRVVVSWTLPPLNPPVSNCPTPQLSSPFQHNNSIAAPGASCYPELSFVFLLLSLLDWMLALCDRPVSPTSSPLITFLKLNEKDRMMDTWFGLSTNFHLHLWHSLKPASFRISALSVSGSVDLM